MSKVLSLHEAIRGLLDKQFNTDNYSDMQCLIDIDKVLDFYNQPFSTDMLVNPYESGDIIYDMTSEEWVNHESLRLFDGWEKIGHGKYKFKNLTLWWYGGKCSSVLSREKEEKYWEFKTLNDFITLCNLAGIELQWNSNPTVKELGL